MENIILSTEQKTLFETMEQTRQHLFITGRAGTGKSVLLRHFRENTVKKVVVAAPTGIAALNVKGQTIHSLFKVPPQLHRKGQLASNTRLCSLLKRIETLIIDEVSMVRADLLDAINERFQEAFRNNLPFGGVQVILFGDVYQLPPVVEENLMQYFEAVHQGHFFFNAHVWQQTNFKIYELTQIFRQKDPVFKTILNAVRDGTILDEQIDLLNERCNGSIPDEGTVTLAPTNALVTGINQRRLDQLPEEAHHYEAIITGEMKKSIFPTEEHLQLKKGAQIVLLKNDPDRRWVNGTVGKIENLSKEKIDVRVGDNVYTVQQETWEEIAYTYDQDTQKVEAKVASSFTQYPVRLAWALTIHKSQGQTYENVNLDLTTATFAAGQLYVALSRCTSLEGLYLKIPVKRAHIIVEPKVTAFMLKRETIIVEAKKEELHITKEIPLTINEQDSSDGQEHHLLLPNFAASDSLRSTPTTTGEMISEPKITSPNVAATSSNNLTSSTLLKKKRGRPRTGRTKENVTLSLDKTVIEFLTSLPNQSEVVNDLLLQSKEYQQWEKACISHFN